MAGQEGPPDSIVRQSSEAPQMSGLPLAAWSLPLGAVLDLALGDPRGWPHPVRAIGWLIAVLERGARRLLAATGGGPRAERAAGMALAAIVVGTSGGLAGAWVAAADRLGPVASLLGRAVLIYWGLAAR